MLKPSLEDIYLDLTGGTRNERPPTPVPGRTAALLAKPRARVLHVHLPAAHLRAARLGIRRRRDRGGGRHRLGIPARRRPRLWRRGDCLRRARDRHRPPAGVGRAQATAGDAAAGLGVRARGARVNDHRVRDRGCRAARARERHVRRPLSRALALARSRVAARRRRIRCARRGADHGHPLCRRRLRSHERGVSPHGLSRRFVLDAAVVSARARGDRRTSCR